MAEPIRSRPRILLNCAVSLDGRLAYAGGLRARLSGPEDLRRVQQLRAETDAILVGVGTILADDPSLRVHWELLRTAPGHEPLRVVLDSRGRTPAEAKVLGPGQATLIATASDCRREFPSHVQRFAGGSPSVDVPGLLRFLSERGVRSVLVEGGAQVLSSFLRGGWFDRWTVYVAPVVIGGTTAPSMVAGPETVGAEATVRLLRRDVRALDDGVLLTFDPTDA
jgi:2,5-diamino-6-(ribosylamino)-4(3H)-pyrimidinone 5'-phosphate reductase